MQTPHFFTWFRSIHGSNSANDADPIVSGKSFMTSWPIVEHQQEMCYLDLFNFSSLIQIFQLIFGLLVSKQNGSKWNTESLAKYWTIHYTAFSWNNRANFFNNQILADKFVLNLKKWKKKLKVPFSYWYSTVGHEVRRHCLVLGLVSHTEYDLCTCKVWSFENNLRWDKWLICVHYTSDHDFSKVF